MIQHRWRAVEADIQAYYGLDARGLGARRLLSLVYGLPSGAKTFGGGGWMLEHELLASLLEVSVNSKKKKGKPFKVPRPKIEKGPKPSMTPLEQLRLVAGMAKKGKWRRDG